MQVYLQKTREKVNFVGKYAEKYRDTIPNKKQTRAALQADGH